MGKWKGQPHGDIPRCGARTRQGGACGHFAMKNGRCRYHGGKSTGPRKPIIKHGFYTKELDEFRRIVAQILSERDN